MTIQERFDAVEAEYLWFDRVEPKRSARPDLHALLLLDELFPKPGRDIISAAEHDTFYLDAHDAQIESLTDAQILELTRCGVRYDSDLGVLAMFA